MFPTYDNKVAVINAVIKDGGYGEEILQALREYDEQFTWKCGVYCPFTIKRGRWYPPGFATRADLTKHREQDHTKHGLYIEWTITGNPRYCCDCGENHYLNQEEMNAWEEGGYHTPDTCSDREAHLERVRNETVQS